jgi:hypothetical protein
MLYLFRKEVRYLSSAELHPKERETLQNHARRVIAHGGKNGRAISIAQDCTTSDKTVRRMECNLARRQDIFYDGVFWLLMFFVLLTIFLVFSLGMWAA